MSWSGNRSPSGLLPREVAGAMAMVTLGTERDADVVAFTSGRGGWGNPWAGGAHGVAPIPDLSPRQRLDDALATIDRMPMGGTDCAAPMLYALDKGLEYDAFVIYTDNETWAGQIHPHQALKLYRERTGIPAKLVVVAATPTPFTIADPTDGGMLDVVGMDTAAPAVISDFIRG
ncbi:MAG TPA: hypothetical protein VKZ65_08590, partial [Glycomyces sp.]|nr:hypothetical protein [Glycomyces sp.]